MGIQASSTFPINSMPLPIDQVESPTQPKPYSTGLLTDFPQVTLNPEDLTGGGLSTRLKEGLL